MRHTVAKCERLFCWMQQLSQESMVTGQKLGPISQRHVNHGAPHSRQYRSGLLPEPVTVSWSLSLNQVDFMFALRLFSSQVRKLVQCVEIGPR